MHMLHIVVYPEPISNNVLDVFKIESAILEQKRGWTQRGYNEPTCII